MNKKIFTVALAGILTLGIAAPTIALAEKDGNGNHGSAKAEVKHESKVGVSLEKGKNEAKDAAKHAGNSAKNIQKSVSKNTKEFSDNAKREAHAFSDKARNKGNEIKHEAREFKDKTVREAREHKPDHKFESRNNGRAEFGMNRAEERANENAAFKENEHDRRHENRDDRNISGDITERSVFVRGIPTDKDGLVLIDLTPDNQDYIRQIYIDNRRDNQNWFSRFIPFGGRHEIVVGRSISQDLFDDITLLPLSVNARLGLPTDDNYRVGVIDDRLVLIDTDRLLVLDTLQFDDDNNIIASDIDVLDDRLWTVRFDDGDRSRIRTYLVSHPEYYDQDRGWFDQFQQNVLIPIGFGPRITIGETLPSSVDVSYLPSLLTTQLDLPGTDLRVGLAGDDVVLLDTRTAVVLDVIPNVI